MARRQPHELFAPANKKGIEAHDDSVRPLSSNSLERCFQLAFCTHIHATQLQAKDFRRALNGVRLESDIWIAWIGQHHDNDGSSLNQRGCQSWQPVNFTLCPAVFN